MRIAPEGWPFIGIAVTIEALLFIFLPWWAAVLWLPILIWVAAFFRDPEREGPRGDSLVISPADGKVVSVIDIDEPLVINGPATRVSIFMNVFSVHVNRYPASGLVTFRKHHHGKFGHAGEEKASLENEHSDIGVSASRGPVLTRQIAGSIARRIVTDHETGTPVRQGERLGMIRFGSRVDVFVPAGIRILVKEGDLTQAGVTVLAEWT